MSMILLLLLKELIHGASIGSRLHKYSKYSEPLFGIIARWVIYQKINLDMEGILETPYFIPFVHHFSHLLLLVCRSKLMQSIFFCFRFDRSAWRQWMSGDDVKFLKPRRLPDCLLQPSIKLNRITWYSMICIDEANAIYA